MLFPRCIDWDNVLLVKFIVFLSQVVFKSLVNYGGQLFTKLETGEVVFNSFVGYGGQVGDKVVS